MIWDFKIDALIATICTVCALVDAHFRYGKAIRQRDIEVKDCEHAELLYEDMSAELRKRREPEVVLTGALLAAQGAVAWGGASIGGARDQLQVACALVAGMGIFITFRMRYENDAYIQLRATQIKLMKCLLKKDLQESVLPPGFETIRCGGYLVSIITTVWTTALTVGFLISLIYKKC